MSHIIESDGTYCSEIEKEDRTKIRRSKRLSQRNFIYNFRDPIQRLHDIHQMLKCGTLCSKWMIGEWQTLQFEVELIQKELKGKQKGRIALILKKINKSLQNLNSPKTTNLTESSSTIQAHQSNGEQVKSPNILAGMMTEVLSEVPPHQPENLPETMNLGKKSELPSVGLTQKNPIDLTTRNTAIKILSHIILPQHMVQIQKQQILDKLKTPPRNTTDRLDQNKTPSTTSALSISKDSVIDLTEESATHTNGENTVPFKEVRKPRSKSPVHVSKWLKFLSTQERSIYVDKSSTTSTTAVAPTKSNNSKSFLKQNLLNVDKGQSLKNTSVASTIHKPLANSFVTKSNNVQQSRAHPHPDVKSKNNEGFGKKAFRSTENLRTKNVNDNDLAQIRSQRCVQSEHFRSLSPDFNLVDEFLDLSPSDFSDNEPFYAQSLRDDLKKVYGTDNMKDIFLHDEFVYSLKEDHIIRLAKALNVKYEILKTTIEKVLSNERIGSVEDENMQSDGSVIECSQSPPQRLFPSQRSQK